MPSNPLAGLKAVKKQQKEKLVDCVRGTRGKWNGKGGAQAVKERERERERQKERARVS